MKKTKATFGALLILAMLLGCLDKADANQEVYSIATEIIWPIQLENKSNVLSEDTVYDEDGYYIAMPKGSEITKLTNGYIWTINSNSYLIQFQIFKLSDAFNTETFRAAPALLDTVKKAIESNSNNTVKMNNDYKTMQLDGKNAIFINGTVNRDDLSGDMNVYLIDSKSGLIYLSFAKVQNKGDIASKISIDAIAIGVLSSIKIK